MTDVTADVMKPASLLNQDSLTDDEAIVETRPFDPVNAKPCARDGSNTDELNVDDAVENRPFRNPTVVDVPVYVDAGVNGYANVAYVPAGW